ncbi:hypothetical protein HH308_15195 [Gordonia sp. TBRC 11910]|uniref:Uncharacterized protein n=1 Tax=Gordonia asplenii TaxID=2725283 RepID=A0A848KWA2_9ACTN|nr:hypothetical protein [Gordonia asplenii]NMO02559.1 hypothetical protein [Gordonia asplenii]
MSGIDHDQARSALDAARRAQRSVADEVGLPRGYWWGMAAGWVVLGLLADFTPSWVTTVATIAFSFGHALLATRLLDGRHRTSGIQLSRETASRKIPLIVTGILLVMVALTIAAGFALGADGAAHSASWAAVIVGAVVGFGGPEIFSAARRLAHA